MKHTPGDWEYIKMTGRVVSGDVRICGINGFMSDTGNANARLIAAAPDLLEALENLVRSNAPEHVIAAENAIAKAKGGAA